jgi:peroxiredoxin
MKRNLIFSMVLLGSLTILAIPVMCRQVTTTTSGSQESTSSVQHKTTMIKPDENTIYKDENGKIISRDDYQAAVKEGGYGFKPTIKDGRIAEIRLYKLTPEEIEKKRNGSSSIGVGKVAPDFKAKTLDGREVSLQNLKGKIVVMNLWFVACAPCIAEMPQLNKIVEKYKDQKDVVFLAPAMDDAADIKSFLKGHPFNYQIVPAANNIIKSYDTTVFPTHIIIGKDGTIMKRFAGLGPNSVDMLSSDVAAVIAGKPVSQEANSRGSNETRINTNGMIFKNENGEVLDKTKAMEMVNSQQYFPEKKTDSDGKDYILLKKRN